MGNLAYAFRSLRKAPLASLTIVVTVALGLGMVAAVFTFLNVFLFRVDRVPNIHELYGVERPRTADGDLVALTRARYDDLRRETTAFSDVFAMVAETDSRIDGRTWSGTLVTGNFFDVLGVTPMLGRALSPADDEQANPVVVLSHTAWMQHYAGDPAVVGRSLLINGRHYDIVGVTPEGFRGLRPGSADYFAPLSLIAPLQPAMAGRDYDVDIIGRLRPGVSRDAAAAQLAAWDSRSQSDATNNRAAGITVVPRRGTVPQPLEALIVFSPLFVAFGLILLIGCANVASLLLARTVSRQKEIGIRLSLGASRRQILRQLLTESLILALAAAVVGYGISRLFLEVTIYAVMTTMPPDIGDVRLLVPKGDWRVAVFLVVGAAAASLMFGLAPALQATRLELVRTIRGEVMRDARPGRTRGLLIGLQVTASALLLICSAVFLRSVLTSSTLDLGFRTSDTVVIQINEPSRSRVIDAIRREPVIAAFAASWPDPAIGSRRALGESTQAKATVAYKFASGEFFDVLGIPVVRGRTFSAAEADITAAVAIVDENLARTLWPSGDAIGQVLRLAPDGTAAPATPAEPPPMPVPDGTFTIVGVARAMPEFPLAEVTPANLYLPITAAHARTAVAARVHGDPARARVTLLERLTAIDPGLEEIITMQTIAQMPAYFMQIAFWLTLVLGSLALVLTLSGLFSVLSYLVEQRTEEIGVRMALGATARDVSRLVLSQVAKPVGVGLAVGAGLALALGIVLLSTVAPIGQFVRLLDPIAYLASLSIIVAACLAAAWVPTMRAAHLDPMKSLRRD